MRAIIRRTVFDSMKGMQFWTLLAFSIILFVMNGLLFCGRYSELREKYDQATASFNPSTRQQILPVPPASLEFMHAGDSSGMPSRYELQPKRVITPVADSQANVRLPVVPSLDWIFIVTVIFSLFVTLIGYDAISGEREDGTLKLTLSNSISRVRFGTAKYCAILCVTAVALLAGAITDIILIGAFRPELLAIDTLVSAGVIIGAAILLCSLFAFMSILISAFAQSSPVALLVLLVIWAFFTIIMPSASPVIARSFISTVGELETARSTQKILESDMDDLMKKVQDNSARGVYRTKEDLEWDAYAVYDEVQGRILRQYEVYNQAMRERNRITRLLARISPSSLFRYASESLSRTGEHHDEIFQRAVRNYSEKYDQYILDKVGKLTQQSRWSFASSFNLHGVEVRVNSPFPEEYKGDKSDFPRFQAPNFSFLDGLYGALGDIAGLAIWNLIVALGMFAALQRMDVR